MYHGYGLLDKAIKKMDDKDKFKIQNFVDILTFLTLT